ncbi:protease inhibitor Inh/omp19 family protein [Mesorhizobium sp. J18]|uniref:protease inhibitor Inh/omp19 family protein n=1 Tax=Mesorhizobium sp. J18 TaxID=935263 RepID=UPI0011A69FE5|nr:protease inhibitor Inh/omp19 family protein [Mesorhizobium sp. J18]
MSRSKIAMVAVSLTTLLAAGCQSDRFSQPQSAGPAPLTPAPSGTVQSSQLPPPSGPLSPTEFPQAPQQEQQMAALDPNAAASGPEISAGSVAGVWTVNVAGQSCRVATPQTKFGQGYRAGPLRCPAPLDGVKSWNVEGGQLAFYDESGGVLARLSSSGNEQFNGQTSTGQPISLSR